MAKNKTANKHASSHLDVTSVACAVSLLSFSIVLFPLCEQRWPTNCCEVQKHCVTSVHLQWTRVGGREGVSTGFPEVIDQDYVGPTLMRFQEKKSCRDAIYCTA